MAKKAIKYPDDLPHPQVGQFAPRERRAINREFMRPVSRDRGGVRAVAFIFTPDQARIFRDWYTYEILEGGGFFAASWPMPWGRGPNVFRFVQPPLWQLVGGGIDGQGYWRVTADVELRGRGALPEIEVFVVTSKPYPYEAEDDMQVALPVFKDAPHPHWLDAMGIGMPRFANGTLRDPLVAYNSPVESIGISNITFSNGNLRELLITYKGPDDEIGIGLPTFTDGVLKDVVVKYENWPLGIEDESIEVGLPTFTDGTLS